MSMFTIIVSNIMSHTCVLSSGSSVTVLMICQQGVMPVPPAIKLIHLMQTQTTQAHTQQTTASCMWCTVQKHCNQPSIYHGSKRLRRQYMFVTQNRTHFVVAGFLLRVYCPRPSYTKWPTGPFTSMLSPTTRLSRYWLILPPSGKRGCSLALRHHKQRM